MAQNGRKLEARGFDLPNGEWRLYDDGTLSFAGTGELRGLGYRAYRNRIRRIEIEGFETIASCQFEKLPNLTEVVLVDSVWVVEEGAFRGCPMLTDVQNIEGVVVTEGAFEDTPYGAAVAASEKAMIFWNEMDKCLFSLRYPLKDSRQLLPAMEMLRSGAQEGNPELMYLLAEFLNWGSKHLHWSYGDDYRYCVQALTGDNEAWQELEEDPVYWYTRSADAGYVPALCRLGWNAMLGRHMEKDPVKAQHYFHLAKQHPVSSLAPEDLNLFARVAYELEDLAYYEDIEENCNCSDPNWIPSNPTWRDLHGSALAVYELGCMFGCLQCTDPEEAGLAYRYGFWQDDYDPYARAFALDKYLLQIWCALEGILTVSPETVRSWLAAAAAQSNRDSQLAAMLEELTPKVLAL